MIINSFFIENLYIFFKAYRLIQKFKSEKDFTDYLYKCKLMQFFKRVDILLIFLTKINRLR